jgi:hypothetical protein
MSLEDPKAPLAVPTLRKHGYAVLPSAIAGPKL